MEDKEYINYQDSLGYTALMYASMNGHMEIVKLLLENGADTSIKNNDGKTALILAFENNHIDIVDLIEEFDTEYTPRIIN